MHDRLDSRTTKGCLVLVVPMLGRLFGPVWITFYGVQANPWNATPAPADLHG